MFRSTGEQDYSRPRDRDNDDKNRIEKRLPADEKEIYIFSKDMFQRYITYMLG